MCYTPYTLSVKLNDFTVWRHTWRQNWVNCAVLTDNSAGLRTVLSSRLSHRELRSSLRESHGKRQPCFYPPQSRAQEDTPNWQKKLTNLMGNLCCAREHSVQFFVQFFYAVKLHSLTWSVWGPLDTKLGALSEHTRGRVTVFLYLKKLLICASIKSRKTSSHVWVRNLGTKI